MTNTLPDTGHTPYIGFALDYKKAIVHLSMLKLRLRFFSLHYLIYVLITNDLQLTLFIVTTFIFFAFSTAGTY